MNCMNDIKKAISNLEQNIVNDNVRYEEVLSLAEMACNHISGVSASINSEDAAFFNNILADMAQCLESKDFVYLYDLAGYILPAHLTDISERYGIEG